MIIRIYQCTNCKGEWGNPVMANKHVCDTKNSTPKHGVSSCPDSTNRSSANDSIAQQKEKR